ncbi:DUF2235 domain-containing protein [Mucilaginibacter psychrotolerans]|uniref:DUF2235 domain-containing protein n=1 Tax=Mucilaginibacter psychrotolerans TaxID=1524096 RepID=A0A4Y8RY99_9SPHI|nr:DUF2235 domain-containing protein [Mucilaginibacter psychrotolerans]TFF30400.1 DUF2235 domain-containing protein [Mucilaginibacter psychrotolerans]
MEKINKRIITCSDGTWNKPGDVDEGAYVRTNVQKIFEAICNEDGNGVKQIKYYDEGVGSTGSELRRIIDGATGYGLDENILDAYKFIIWNYEIGDEIYLFGFSRGAYTARSLAGLIRTVGLVKNNDLRLIQQAYDIYRDRNDPDKNPNGKTAEQFRLQYSQPVEVKIKFIGVWDTVGELGIPFMMMHNKEKYEFHDTTLSSYVDFAYHALAIDEQRKSFEPTLWEQSDKARQAGQTMEQRWFAGVHSNIGGGYADEGLSDITLDWMIKKAAATNLAFEQGYIDGQIKRNKAGTLYDSNKPPFSFIGAHIRELLTNPNANETIDDSVYERMALDFSPEEGYSPENVPVRP